MQAILRTVPIMEAVEYVARERFAWPGGYALGVLTDDGACLCSACVVKELERIRSDYADGYKGGGFYPSAAYVTDADDDGYGEGEEAVEATICDHCNRPITDSTTPVKS